MVRGDGELREPFPERVKDVLEIVQESPICVLSVRRLEPV